MIIYIVDNWWCVGVRAQWGCDNTWDLNCSIPNLFHLENSEGGFLSLCELLYRALCIDLWSVYTHGGFNNNSFVEIYSKAIGSRRNDAYLDDSCAMYYSEWEFHSQLISVAISRSVQFCIRISIWLYYFLNDILYFINLKYFTFLNI